ncbi:MAG: hypothetical protein IKU79_03165 [Bacteroidaceae bacterium]|nr:hypothetical protein [Bacteroidaceae bacterium]
MMKKFLITLGVVLIALTFWPAVILLIVARAKGWKKYGDIAECAVWWHTFSFMLPYKAKKMGVISNKIWAWLLVLISPLAWIVYTIIFLCILAVNLNKPLEYDELPFKTKEDMCALTGFEEFPEFEYMGNRKDGWDGIVWTEFRFSDEKSAEVLMQQIEAELKNEDNIFWSKDSLRKEEDKKFFGCEVVYVMERGWDSIYIEGAQEMKEQFTQVRMCIGEKGFALRHMRNWGGNLDYYSNVDSLSALTGVAFPEYKMVNLGYNNYFVDSGWRATLKLNTKPSKTFINAIKNSPNWEQTEDGCYHFHQSDRSGQDLWEDIIVNPKNKVVHLSVSNH